MKICGLMKTTLLDYPGHLACTVFTGGCNFRCPFCHNAELLDMDLPAEYIEDEILSFLNKRKNTLQGVAITGGEPTLQKDLPDFILRIRRETGLSVKLDSNGFNPQMLEELIVNGLIDYAAMDIKAGEDRYSEAAGIVLTETMMTNMKRSIALLMQGRIPFEFRTTVVGGLHTEEDFEKIGELIRGCGNYYLQCYKDSGNVLDRQRGFYEPSKEELLRCMRRIEPYVGCARIRGIDY